MKPSIFDAAVVFFRTTVDSGVSLDCTACQHFMNETNFHCFLYMSVFRTTCHFSARKYVLKGIHLIIDCFHPQPSLAAC